MLGDGLRPSSGWTEGLLDVMHVRPSVIFVSGSETRDKLIKVESK